MCSYVSLEVSSLIAGVVTLFAVERLHSTVNQNVHLQMRSTYRLVSTLVATVRLLSMMLNRVHFEVFLRFEGDIALNTRFGFDHFHC